MAVPNHSANSPGFETRPHATDGLGRKGNLRNKEDHPTPFRHDLLDGIEVNLGLSGTGHPVQEANAEAIRHNGTGNGFDRNRLFGGQGGTQFRRFNRFDLAKFIGVGVPIFFGIGLEQIALFYEGFTGRGADFKTFENIGARLGLELLCDKLQESGLLGGAFFKSGKGLGIGSGSRSEVAPGFRGASRDEWQAESWLRGRPRVLEA
jgi:hypothetical protein